MPKLRIANAKIDNLLNAAGKSKVISKTSDFSGKLQNSSLSSVRISVLDSKMMESEEGIYEIAKIRIDPNDKRNITISSAISIGGNFLNHNLTIPKLIDLNEEEESNITKATPSFSIDSKFNYISQDYDNLQVNIPEHNLNAFMDDCTVDEILNFRKRETTRLSKFDRGSQMKNFVVPEGSVDKFSKSAPYYIRIGLNDGVRGDISKFLQKLSIYDEVLNDYIKADKKSLLFNIQDDLFVMENSQLMGYDISSFFDSNIEIDLDNFYGLNQGLKSSKMSYDLRKHLFKGYLKGITKTGFRSFAEILNNVECNREALCYSFEKFDQFDLDSTRIQNIYAPAGDLSTSFVDTQVKYGKSYLYKVKAHYVIVGNQYTYNNVNFYEEDGVPYGIAEVVNRPSIMVIPIDLFSASKAVIQPPPAFPQVSFKTENNSSKEIQIYLSPTKSEIKSDFIEILESDRRQTKLLSEFYPLSRGGYTFHSAVDSGLYEIFRMKMEPKDLKDFANSKLAEIRMPFRTTDAVFKDVVTSNEDYYYMFRQINEKSLVSNPTSIFKVRLVVDADDAKVVVDTYEIKQKPMSQPRRNFKSLIQVRPAVEQTIFMEGQDALYDKESLKGLIDKIKLGTQRNAVWGRKFKLRVRSKTSGKMIDININFELAKNKTKEEF